MGRLDHGDDGDRVCRCTARLRVFACVYACVLISCLYADLRVGTHIHPFMYILSGLLPSSAPRRRRHSNVCQAHPPSHALKYTHQHTHPHAYSRTRSHICISHTTPPCFLACATDGSGGEFQCIDAGNPGGVPTAILSRKQGPT